MNVTVFGLGYVGCVTAACLARGGHHVVGVDLNADKVGLINDGKSPIVEPGLGELIASSRASGRLRSTDDPVDALKEADVALICVGTPSLPHGRPDVEAIDHVGQEIGRSIGKRDQALTVVLRSTVLPGTMERVLEPALRAGLGEPLAGRIRLAVNPEFMREGSSLADFDEPPMILAGVSDPAAASVVRTLYHGVRAPFVQTSIRTAELVKFAANAYHGLKVCFANEIGDLAQALGADGNEVMKVFAMDRKLNVSAAYLRPGFAFGGSCLPKDLRALVWAARAHDVDVPVLRSVLPSNEAQIQGAIDRVLQLRKKRVAIAGLAFKPDTDDLRESPVVTLVEALIGKGCRVRILDRNVSMARLTGANRRYIEGEIPHIASLLCESVEELVADADVLVLGSASEDAAQALAGAGPDCSIVDLTRGAVQARAAAAEEAPAAQPSEAAVDQRA
jgi:GDP-mannose 6-dehydrogenase